MAGVHEKVCVVGEKTAPGGKLSAQKTSGLPSASVAVTGTCQASPSRICKVVGNAPNTGGWLPPATWTVNCCFDHAPRVSKAYRVTGASAGLSADVAQVIW